MQNATTATEATTFEFKGATFTHDPAVHSDSLDERRGMLSHVDELLVATGFEPYSKVTAGMHVAQKSSRLYEQKMWDKVDRNGDFEEALVDLFKQFQKDGNTSAAQTLKQTCADFNIDLTKQVTLEMKVRVTVTVPANFDVDEAGDCHPSIDFDDHHFHVDTHYDDFTADDFELFDGEVEMTDFEWKN